MSRQALAEAMATADPRAVSAALDRYPALKSHLDAPLARDPFGTTPLIAAAMRGQQETIDLLLRAGADINARSHWWAGSFGALDFAPVETAQFLLQRGATLDVHSAARLNRVAELAAMLDSNPTLVNARGGDGQTPLHFAGSVEVAALLLEKGAKIDARDIDHESTPAQYMLRDRLEVAKYLVGQGCQTDILMAAAIGDLDSVRQHVTRQPESIYTTVCNRHFPKTNPESGGSIYMWTLGLFKTAHAAVHENQAVADFLLAHTPIDLELVIAAQMNSLERVLELLKTDKQLQFANDQLTSTALHWSAWHGSTPMLRALIEQGAPLEVRDAQYGMTPLGWAMHASGSSKSKPGSDFPGAIAALQAAGAESPSR